MISTLVSMTLACGGFFGGGVEVSPNQTIVVTHRDGVETYIFRPHFCGTAKDFGVILPIPSTLTTNPTLAADSLFTELSTFTTPTIEEVCTGGGGGCGAMGAARGDFNGSDSGVVDLTIINRGSVGIFDYVLLQATSTTAFTDWLDANGFPHAASDGAYDSYVTQGWYFVAFKVSADSSAPAPGKKLCGDLGPISLSFKSARPVVPASIASVNGTGGTWRIFTVAPARQRLIGADGDAGPTTSSTLYFAGVLSQSALTSYPELKALSREGERLTALDVKLQGSDLVFDDDVELNFRSKRQVGKTCSGCATTETMPVIGFALALLARSRRRRA